MRHEPSIAKTQFVVRLALAFGGLLVGCAASNPGALWRIVHEDCVPALMSKGQSGQCREIDVAGRYAVLKDRVGDTHFLVLPTDRITGIESPAILRNDALNYWQAAWMSRRFSEEAAGRGLARDEVGLAINSARRRTQNQLHIHIDCVRVDLRAGLQALEAKVSEHWSSQPMTIAGHSYYVMKIHAEDLERVNPFRRLAQRLAHPASEMGRQSLSVIGAQFADGTRGFYLLDSPFGKQGATSEDVLDRRCELLRAIAAEPRAQSAAR